MPGDRSIAASSSQNSLPGGSFMEVNTDMRKALRRGYICCVPGCYSNTKRDTVLSFHKFPKDVYLREKWVNSIKRKILFLVSSTLYSHGHFHSAKGMADQISLLYFHYFLSPNRERLQKYACHSNGRKLEQQILLWKK